MDREAERREVGESQEGTGGDYRQGTCEVWLLGYVTMEVFKIMSIAYTT